MKRFLLGLLVSLLILSGCSSVTFESSYDTAQSYFKYLEKVEESTEWIEGYIDDSTEEVMIDLYNGSDYFWLGEIEVVDSQEKKIGGYTTKLVRPQSYYYSFDPITGEPDGFVIKESQFYQFTYPNAPVAYEVIYDITSDYSAEWYNILLNQACTIENVKLAAQYQYAADVVSDEYYSTYYFYDENMTMYYDQEYKTDYPDTESAVYGAKMDFDLKTITIYTNQENEWVEVETLTME